MPHARPGKEWLHLRDAICLGNVDAIIDQLTQEGLRDQNGRAYHYEDMKEILTAAKLQVGWDACAVVDKDTFQDSISYLVTQTINLYQPQDTQIDSYKDSMVEARWDRVFNDMAGRASGRIPGGPSHYTKDTPQGALEGMEERLANEGKFERRITRQMVDNALNELNIKMSELQGAMLGLITDTRQDPSPIVEKIEEAAEAIGTAVERIDPYKGPWQVQRDKRAAIIMYMREQGSNLSSMTAGDVAGAVRQSWPTANMSDVRGAWNKEKDAERELPTLASAPRGRRPRQQPSSPSTPVIPVQPMESGELGDLLGGLTRPQRWY